MNKFGISIIPELLGMGPDFKISEIVYIGFLVCCTNPETISSWGSWIFVLADSYMMGYMPIFAIGLMWAQRLIVPGMGTGSDGIIPTPNIAIELVHHIFHFPPLASYRLLLSSNFDLCHVTHVGLMVRWIIWVLLKNHLCSKFPKIFTRHYHERANISTIYSCIMFHSPNNPPYSLTISWRLSSPQKSGPDIWATWLQVHWFDPETSILGFLKDFRIQILGIPIKISCCHAQLLALRDGFRNFYHRV